MLQQIESEQQKALAKYQSRHAFVDSTLGRAPRAHTTETSTTGLPLYVNPVENLVAAASIFEGIEISQRFAAIVSHRVALVRKALEQQTSGKDTGGRPYLSATPRQDIPPGPSSMPNRQNCPRQHRGNPRWKFSFCQGIHKQNVSSRLAHTGFPE
jgi:hypothetical protein